MPIRDLFSHAWQHSSAQRRLAAVRSITDQRLLEKIARRGSHADVRITAALRLTNEDALIRVIERTPDGEVRAAALGRLSNDARAGLVSMTRLDAEVRRAAYEAITLPSTRTRVMDHLVALVFRSPTPATLERLWAIGWLPRNDDERALAAMAAGDWTWLLEVGRRSPRSVRRLIAWDDSLRDHVADACMGLLTANPPAAVEDGARFLELTVRQYEDDRWRGAVFQRERRGAQWTEALAQEA